LITGDVRRQRVRRDPFEQRQPLLRLGDLVTVELIPDRREPLRLPCQHDVAGVGVEVAVDDAVFGRVDAVDLAGERLPDCPGHLGCDGVALDVLGQLADLLVQCDLLLAVRLDLIPLRLGRHLVVGQANGTDEFLVHPRDGVALVDERPEADLLVGLAGQRGYLHQ
jgi:hypothetical protein